VTGKVKLDSYRDAGVLVSIDLVNELAIGRAEEEGAREAVATLKRILAVDADSVAALRPAHASGFQALARELRRVFADLDGGDLDAAAVRLNRLLAKYPAHPHLAKEDGRWRLHHHPEDAPLLAMWSAICAEGLASMIAADKAARLGICERVECGRAYVDLTRNASRRFCCLNCQNRVKVAAFRERSRSRVQGFGRGTP
jgi:predicted RNA-binding Zn ribbon-like protein